MSTNFARPQRAICSVAEVSSEKKDRTDDSRGYVADDESLIRSSDSITIKTRMSSPIRPTSFRWGINPVSTPVTTPDLMVSGGNGSHERSRIASYSVQRIDIRTSVHSVIQPEMKYPMTAII